MGKLKVYELAKELGLSNTEMLEKIKSAGIDVKSHLSTLDEKDVERLRGNTKKSHKEDKKPEQMHIIRRNVRVINTNEEGKEINEITTNIAGDIKKTHKETTITNNKSNRTNKGEFQSRNNYYDRKNRFPGNRISNIVITRNGKPVETKVEEKKEEVKVEKESVKDMEEKVVVNKVDTNKVESNIKENKTNNIKEESNIKPVKNNKDNYKRGNYNSQNNPNYNKNSNKEYGKKNNFNKRDQQNNGDRPQRNNFRRDQRRNGDNTSYQVNKFIKQSEKAPIEQKETREYSSANIDKDKKKYIERNNSNIENRKEKIDKNKLREEHSRVATSRLRGMEISSEGLMDLYERESDLSRKSYGKKKNKTQKTEMKQTKIIPMTEVKLPETMTVKEFAEAIKKQASEVIKKLFSMGIMATVNQDIDFDTAYLIASEFGITAEKEVVVTEEDILFDDSEDKEEDLVPRPPIVVVMGHVDHGKTSLLDRLRKTNVVEGEAGGITQHIGAYKVKVKDREVCFLDTPGHEAFTAMRARGAQITDIAIIIVAADDGIKPQTIEAIDHAKAAGVSILVAINKIDKPGANVERVKQELLEVGLVPEEWGGDTICVPISARTGEGIDTLLEMLLLIADMKDLKANPNKQAKGTVIEARLDKKRGTVVSMLVQRGQLNVGDTIVVGDMVSKIRAMKDDKGRAVKSAGPSTPVEILGLSHVPETGEVFYEVENEKVAKQLIEKRIAKHRMELIKQGSKITLDDLFGQIKQGKIKELNIIIKADVQGSVEALKDLVSKIRAMKDDKGRAVKSAGPSTPVEILGLSHVPETGEVFYEVENEKVAKQLIEKRIAKHRMELIKQGSKITLDDLFGQIKQGKIKELNIIIKADVQGSVEALKDSLLKLSNDEVRVRIIHASTGGIKESDVTLASVSNAIIIGFNVRPESAAEAQAKKEKVDMRLYSVIYDAINDVETALKGMMPKKYKEVLYGRAEVRKIFKITGVGTVAGCYVKSGKIVRGAMVRLVRDSIVLLEIKIDSLRREKDDVKEVAEGYECGIKLENYSDIKEGDIFECFVMEEVK